HGVEGGARTRTERAQPIERLLVRRRRERAAHGVAVAGRHEVDRRRRKALERLGAWSPRLEPSVGELLATNDAGEIRVDVEVGAEDRDERCPADRGLATGRDEEHAATDRDA